MACSNDSATSQGHCVVCGQLTSNRCSECAKFGTDWMYFCGREHQKLIWKVHKRVCGDKSNPFHFPLLSEDEIQHYTKVGQKRLHMKPGFVPAVASWCETVHASLQPHQLKIVQAAGLSEVEAFESGLRMIGKDREGALRPMKRMTKEIQGVRCESWKAEVGAIEQATRRPLDVISMEQSGSNPFGRLATLQETLEIPNFDDKDQVYSRWWSRFDHLALIRLFVASLVFTDSTEENKAYLNYTQYAVERFIESTPSEVREIAGSFLCGGEGEGVV